MIKNGTVVDGTRIPRFQADVGIKDGLVATIGYIDASEAAETLDATGLIVAPGFIDLHTHYDAQLFWDPYCTISGWHGVTSVVIGNCGFGFAPMRVEDRERSMLSMTRVEAIPLASMQVGLPWSWVTFPEFLDAVDAAPKALNILPYVPVGPLLAWVLGYDDAKAGRRPTDAEHEEIAKLLHEAMDAGGCGWSVQRLLPDGPGSNQRDFDGTPMITDVMHDDTCRVLAHVLRERNEGFIEITMNTSDVKESAVFQEELASISGRPLLYNSVQARNDRPNIHRNAMKWLERCHQRGLRVIGQGMTTDAGSTFTFEDWNLFDESEPWREATTGTMEERLFKLGDPARRQALKDELPTVTTGPIPNFTILGPRTPETKPYENLTVGEAAERMGKHFVDAMLDIAVADGLRTLFYAPPPNDSLEYLREIVQNPYVLLGVSDGGAHTKFLTTGRFPTDTIITVVRENAMLSLEEAHWRLSAFPASVAGFKGRGTITEGSPADIVVYDYENLEITPTEVAYDLPGNDWRRIQRARGYRYVLVNGTVTIRDDEETGQYPGALLRHGASAPLASSRA